jgi:hypothetical protein
MNHLPLMSSPEPFGRCACGCLLVLSGEITARRCMSCLRHPFPHHTSFLGFWPVRR